VNSEPEHRGTLALAANAAWNIVNFRSGLIQGLQRAGWQVIALAPRDEHAGRLEAMGCRFIDTPMQAAGTNPADDLRLWRRYRALLRELRPDVFMGYTIKPNIYGSLAAHQLGIPVVNNITGLGSAFIGSHWLAWVARWLYRRALRRSYRVVFENADDQAYFVSAGLVRREQTRRMPSCGIDLQAFALAPLPPLGPGEAMRFLMVGRLLRDKGVVELVEAMRLLRQRGIPAECSTWAAAPTCGPPSQRRTASCCRRTARACRGRCSRPPAWGGRCWPPTWSVAAMRWTTASMACWYRSETRRAWPTRWPRWPRSFTPACKRWDGTVAP